jgi:predicted HicB family RNase H-like nuclease
VIGFHGSTVDELEQDFHAAIDDYRAACRALGQEPNKPYSGKMIVRATPELHAAVDRAARLSGKSINKWLVEVLRKAAG